MRQPANAWVGANVLLFCTKGTSTISGPVGSIPLKAISDNAGSREVFIIGPGTSYLGVGTLTTGCSELVAATPNVMLPRLGESWGGGGDGEQAEPESKGNPAGQGMPTRQYFVHFSSIRTCPGL
jgi:hypothetical protein